MLRIAHAAFSITGAYLVAIDAPIFAFILFCYLRWRAHRFSSKNRRFLADTYGRPKECCADARRNQERDEESALAMWAVVRSAAGKKDTADGGGADQAGLAGAHVDAMLKLEEAADS